MKPILHQTKESAGQAIVLIALLMVILISSVGLAIDGGGMFLLHRDIQNATDAAGLTAAYALCTDGDPIVQAMRSANLNGFDDTDPDTTVNITYPYNGDSELLHVEITAEKPSYFIQVIYPGPLVVTSSTVAFCRAGTSTASSTNVVNQYAMRSLAGPGECTSSPGWRINGTGFTVDGDVWLPNVSGNVEFSSNQPSPEIKDSRADILGDIFIGESSSSNYNNSHNGLNLNEEVPGSAAFNGRTDWVETGTDNVIDYNSPEPGALPYTMDYFRPTGSSLCSTAECGGLENSNPSVPYNDVSPACSSGNKFEAQDFAQNGYGGFYDDTTYTWQPGIYYSSCEITLNHGNNMSGNGVTFITETKLDLSTAPYNMTSPGDAPLFVSNYQSSSNSADCSSGTEAIKINADRSYFSGPIIVFRGFPAFQGNDFLLESCISARGFQHNGNNGAVYRCSPPVIPVQETEFGLDS